MLSLKLFLFLFISTVGYSQLDSLHQQIQFDSIMLVKTTMRIDSLKLELDSLKLESEKNQLVIDKLKQENMLLEKLMKKYQDELARKREEAIKEEE